MSVAWGMKQGPVSSIQITIYSSKICWKTFLSPLSPFDTFVKIIWVMYGLSLPLIFLSLCQYQTVMIILALYYALKSDHVNPLTSLFLFKILKLEFLIRITLYLCGASYSSSALIEKWLFCEWVIEEFKYVNMRASFPCAS